MKIRFWYLLIAILFILYSNPAPALAESPVVHAVLFYSPTCPICEQVIQEVLPPIKEEFKDQLDLVGIDVSTEVGLYLYQAMLVRYQVPNERMGVPTIVVGDHILVGSKEIPMLFPQIIREGLASGGVDWPDIPGLPEVLAAQSQTTDNPTDSSQTETRARSSFVDKFMSDPVANSIAVIVLLMMIASAIHLGYNFINDRELRQWPKWVIPTLALIGFGISIYLSYIEITQSKAICGPLGDCNRVQESKYAYLFGILPIGLMGAIGYLAILGAWLLTQYGPPNWKQASTLSLWGMTWFGILFSIYLTFLEPFVIGATCAWCLISAIIMTLLLYATTGPAMETWQIQVEGIEEGIENDLLDDDDEDEGSLRIIKAYQRKDRMNYR